MSTEAHTTVRLGDLVVVAFDWAAQWSANPQEIPILATNLVTSVLRRSRKTPLSRPAPVALPSGDLRELLELQPAGRLLGASTSRNE